MTAKQGADRTGGIRVASFDVFDTVITRAVGSPEAAFLLLGRRLYRRRLIHCTPETFARARIEAERRAYRNARGECGLEAIYTELGQALGLSEAEGSQLATLEQALEAEILRVVPGASERISSARALGSRVVFISDTYLPSAFLQQQLAQHGLLTAGDGCYASCEHQMSKRSGTLFREVLRLEGVGPPSMSHEGNSQESDVVPALETGIGARLFDHANLNRYEELLEQHSYASEGLSSAFAGASRMARLAVSVAGPREEALRNVAAGVAAPALVGFVLWLLRRADKLGLERLYFISRDGQVLLQIARQLVKATGLRCDLRYLYGSRQAWNLPAVHVGSEDELAWIWDTTDYLSVRSLLARLDLRPEQVAEELSAVGCPESDWDKTLGPAERRALGDLLQTDRPRRLVLDQAGGRRKVLLRYLAQEGVLDSPAWGLVDLGWYGSMQNALSAVLSDLGASVPVGFYFALWKGAIVDACSDRREAYYFDEHRRLGYSGVVPDLIPLMETFCVADHGTVVRLEEQGEGIGPVLNGSLNQKALGWGLPLVRRTIDAFVDNLLLDPDLVNPWADVRDAITDVLQAFWLRPTVAEARAWGSFPWEDGLGAETYSNSLAGSYTWSDLLRCLGSLRVLPHHRASWIAGSLAVSPAEVRIPLQVLRQARWRLRSLGTQLRKSPLPKSPLPKSPLRKNPSHKNPLRKNPSHKSPDPE